MASFPITNYGVVYLSIQQGFFQAEGLNVTPRVMGANPVAGIVGGDFDTGGVTWTAFLLATNRGVPLVPLSEADRGAKGQALFMVKNNSPIKTIEDLVGKKIAVVTVGGACDLILNDLLHKKGLDYKSIGYTVMDVPDMAPTVLRGGVDAACIPDPLLSVVQEQGGLRIGVRSVFRRIRSLSAGRISGHAEVRREQSQHRSRRFSARWPRA